MKRIISLASMLIMLSAFPLNAQLPGDFNCSGEVNGLDMTWLGAFFRQGLIDTGTCVWYNGDLNGDSLYHTVADWRHFIRRMTLDTLPENPPLPFYLDSLTFARDNAEPGDTLVLPVNIVTAETIFDLMLQFQFDTTYVARWVFFDDQYNSYLPFSYHVGGHYYWWKQFGQNGIPAGSYLVGYLSLIIAADCPDNILIPINIIGGDYYPSGFANDSYPTYFIRPVLIDGAVHVSRTSVSEPGIPHDYDFGLRGFPNPFNASTVISYTLPRSGHVQLNIFNVLGRKVATLSDGVQGIGEHKIVWDAGSFPSGIYFARLRMGESGQIIRLALVK